MCGIAGIINKNNTILEQSVINAITDAAAHRGPDGRGVFLHDNIALGHRRLSIIDLSTHANQPMQYGNLIIVFNGEIYNYVEVKQVLVEKGFTFTTQSDTEVILAAYQYWGKDCLHQFNGMWAFAIYDITKQELFCARDRFGVKPFYFTSNAKCFAFGSEIKQLLPLLDSVQPNMAIVADYLVSGFEEHTNNTFFEKIEKLLPGHYLTYQLSTHQFSIQRYYSIQVNHAISELNEEASVNTYKEVFDSAIQLRLRSDVKVGTCLSGGLDSSAVALFASQHYQQHTQQAFTAIHASSTENQNDEYSYAKQVSDFLNLQLHVTKPDKNFFEEYLQKVITTQEEPFGSPSIVMQYFVMQKAKETGTTVMLDGQGGDETFLGYERYFPAIIKAMAWYKKMQGFYNVSQHSKLSFKEILFYYFYFTNADIRIKRLKDKASIFQPELVAKTNFDLIEKLSKSYNNVHHLQTIEIETTQLSHLLKYEDRNSMAHGVEARLPFLDYRCVETALSIHTNFKIKNGWTKYTIRKMIDGKLPDSIVWRKNKIGFEAPVKTWLSNNKNMYQSIQQSTLLKTILKNHNINNLDFKTQWKLYNIAEWEKQFL